MELLFIGIFCVVLFAVALGLVVKKLIHICQPNEVLVFSGTTRQVGDRTVGYTLVQGGRRIRKPLFETVDSLDLTNLPIDVRVQNAYSKGGIPLHVAAVANVKIASQEPFIGNAIERFLGKPREDVVRVAKETLEGNLRGVLSMLTPEEVNQDRVKFAQSLLTEADSDLKKLGLVLDTLKIQHVADDRGYLDSIGRKQSAALLMRSRIAEAENQAVSAEREAENFETREMAKVDAEISIARADAGRRIIDAQTMKLAMVEEQRGEVIALIAKTQGEVKVQTARIDQVRLQLTADRIKGAEAYRSKLVAEAKGESASIVEEGKATARSLTEVSKTWRAAGPDARRIFVAQKLGTWVQQMMSTVESMPIDRITVLGSGLNGDSGSIASTAISANEQLKEAVGVDLPGVLQKLTSSAFGGGAPTGNGA